MPTNSSGWIYDLDAPRLSRYGDSVGEIQRMRANPKTFVQVTVPESSDPVRASGVTPFYVRISIQQQDVLSGTNWTLVNDVSNDNGAGYETKPVTWNLQ